MPDLGKAYVQIVPSAEGIKGSISGVLNGEATAAGKIAGGILGTSISAGALAGGAALRAVGKELVNFASDAVQVGMGFDTAMSQVAATMGTTVSQIGDLRDFAQQMGATTAFSATQAAEALNYMALAGYDAETSMDMLPNVLNLAAAGGIDLARASDMVTDAQSALGLSLEDTNVLVDQMARASSKSNTSVEQLGDAILTIGATARNVKGGTNELATVLGVLADNGIKGAEGGTHLRNIILSLQTPTTAGTAAMKKLGMAYGDMYDEAGNMRSLPEIFLDMQSAMEGMDQASRDAIISGIFNKTDLASVNALLGTSASRFDELAESIGNSQGAAQAMADTQLDNLQGDITLLESATDGLKIAVADRLNPALRFFTQLKTSFVEDLTELVTGSNEAAPSLGELTEAADSLFDTIEQGKEALDDKNTDIESTAAMADRYITALEGMGDAASLTAEEHEQYHNYLVLLTRLIPETANIIDTETDSIEGGTEALRKMNKAWEANARAQAEQEYMAGVQEKYGAVLITQREQSIRLTEVTDRLTAAEKRRQSAQTMATALYKMESAAAESAAREAGRVYDGVFETSDAYKYWQGIANDAAAEASRLTDEQNNLTISQEENAEAVAEAEAAMEYAEKAVATYMDAAEDAAGATGELADGMEAAGKAAENLSETDQALVDIATAANAATESGGDLRAAYDELSGAMDKLDGEMDAARLAEAEQALAALNLAATNQELTASYPGLVSMLQETAYGGLSGLSEWLIANGISAEEWGSQVTGATGNVINGFSELDTSLDMTLDEMASQMEANIAAYTDWEANIASLMEAAAASGNDSQVAFVEYMQQMGIGAAEQVAAMAADTEGSLATFGDLFAQAGAAGMTEFAQSLGDTEMGAAMVEAMQASLDGAELDGSAVAASLADSITENGDMVTEAVEGAMDGAESAVEDTDFSNAAADNAEEIKTAMEAADLPGAAQGIMDEMVTVINGVDFTGAGTSIATELATGIYSGSGLVKSAAYVTALAAKYSAGSVDFYPVGYAMDMGIISGLRAGSNAVVEAARLIAQQAYQAARDALDINSPSKVFRDGIGRAIPEGIADGIEQGAGLVKDSMAALADGTVTAYPPTDADAFRLGSRAIFAEAAADRTVNITNHIEVNGAESPEAYADRLVRRINMQMRMA